MLQHLERRERQQTTERPNHSSGGYQGTGPGSNQHDDTTEPARGSGTQKIESGYQDISKGPEFLLG